MHISIILIAMYSLERSKQHDPIYRLGDVHACIHLPRSNTSGLKSSKKKCLQKSNSFDGAFHFRLCCTWLCPKFHSSIPVAFNTIPHYWCSEHLLSASDTVNNVSYAGIFWSMTLTCDSKWRKKKNYFVFTIYLHAVDSLINDTLYAANEAEKGLICNLVFIHWSLLQDYNSNVIF